MEVGWKLFQVPKITLSLSLCLFLSVFVALFVLMARTNKGENEEKKKFLRQEAVEPVFKNMYMYVKKNYIPTIFVDLCNYRSSKCKRSVGLELLIVLVFVMERSQPIVLVVAMARTHMMIAELVMMMIQMIVVKKKCSIFFLYVKIYFFSLVIVCFFFFK